MSTIPLYAVTMAAKQLQIPEMVSASLRAGNDMIDFKLLRFKMFIAPVAVSALISI